MRGFGCALFIQREEAAMEERTQTDRSQDEYRQPYLTLFNGVTDALDALRRQNYGDARDILTEARQRAEAEYIGA